MSDTILAGPSGSPGLVPPQALEAERAVLAAGSVPPLPTPEATAA